MSDLDLDDIEARVLGCLVEKDRTTPQQYPLSLHALTAACNQSTNRDPVVDYDEDQVSEAIASLRQRGVIRIVHGRSAREVTKYRHVLDEALDLDEAELALVTLLMLRGPQTVGELRQRSERLHPFAELSEVDEALSGLAQRQMVLELPRQAGRSATRWAHLLGERGAEELSAAEAAEEAEAGAGADRRAAPARSSARSDELAELRAEVERLRLGLAEVRRELGLDEM